MPGLEVFEQVSSAVVRCGHAIRIFVHIVESNDGFRHRQAPGIVNGAPNVAKGGL